MSTEIDTKAQEQAESLARLKKNKRVSSIRIGAPKDCSVGISIQGVYDKDAVPELPHKGCSRPDGCICQYEPVLNEIYP